MSTATPVPPAPALLDPVLDRPGPLRAPARDWRSERTGRRALIAMVVLAVLVVMMLAGGRSSLVPPSHDGFPAWLAGPFAGIASFLPDGGPWLSAAFSLMLAALFGCYCLAIACAAHVRARLGVATIVALHVLFLLGPPTLLTDVFNYVNYGRLGALHGANPYVIVPATFPHDPTFLHATWHHLLSPYGPLFTLFAYALVPLGVAGGFWVLKLATVAASLGCLALAWKLAERRGRSPLAVVMFVGLNPLVLVFGIGGVHNDFFMLALLLAAALWVVDGRAARGGGAAVAAIAVKVSAGLMLPFAALGARDRRSFGLGALAAGTALVAVTLAAFGPHAPELSTQSSLVTPLSPPNLLGLALGQGGATAAIRGVVAVGVALAVLVLLRRTWRGADWITAAGWATFALVVGLSWEMPWYVMWVLPLAAVGHSRSLRRATLLLSAFLLVTLAPITGYALDRGCNCYPGDTHTGKRNAMAIKRYLR